jgi:outer membrane receptor protein involved in Fe transport
MERVEVLKGPQNTLFGRGSQIGAIHFISINPGNTPNGYVTAGIGDYGQKEFRGAVNMPVIENKLFVRAAGVYDFQDGFVQNTFGGTLNGKNTMAGRLSVRYLPAKNQKLDLILNYQKDETPGIAFMSKQFPNTEGDTNIFNYRASLEQGKNLKTGKELFDATLNYKYTINEHSYWTSVTNFRKSTSSARWDGDGTASPAIDMWEDAGADQFYQEIRYNFSFNSRLNGSAGASYWIERADQTYWFSPNEQSMAVLFLSPEYLIMPNGQPLLIPALPNIPALGPLAGMPLPANHQENNHSAATNQAAEAFIDATYQLTSRLFLTGGLRTSYESFELSNEAAFTGGEPSTLGLMTGNYPNMFFRPSAEKSMNDDGLSLNWQAGLQYRIDEDMNIFANYSNGRRPVVLQYTSAGTPEVLPAERIDNIDGGFKSNVSGKVFIDVVAFYQKYSNFQSRAWIADPNTGDYNYKTIDGGKATTYGMEATLKASLLRGLDLFGNYAYLHATFDETNSDRSEQEYAGNTFRLSPEHSFSLGFNAQIKITSKFIAFASPSYIYKTHLYFEDANTEGLEQPAYGLMNINIGFELTDPNIILSVYGTNILDEQFITSAGNTGSLFGVPTFVAGQPRMIGTKLTWRF